MKEAGTGINRLSKILQIEKQTAWSMTRPLLRQRNPYLTLTVKPLAGFGTPDG
jgi:hypothetical protein